MPISVRLPPRVEQKLAEYCVSHKISKSGAVKRALEEMLKAASRQPSPYDLGKDLFEKHDGVSPTENIARDSKRLLREHFRPKTRGGR